MSSNSTATSSREHDTLAPQATAVLIACPAIAAVFVALRMYTRVILVKKYFIEDYSVVAAVACAVIASVFMGIVVINGAGRHIEFVTKAELTRLSKAGIGTILFYLLAHCFLKSSILLQYVRISVMSIERRLCYTLIVINGCGYLALIIVHLSRCRPFKANWIPNLPGAYCLNSTASFFSGQIWNMLMDFIILLAPLFILRHMTITSRRERALFSIVLAFGGVACIVSAIRLKTLYLSTTTKDPTYDKVPSGFYAQIELNLGIVCASVVTLRPLFRAVWQRFSGNKSQQPELEGQQQRSRRRATFRKKNPMSIDSTQVTNDSHTWDVELGGTNKDGSRAGSSVTAVETVEGAERRKSEEISRSN